MVHTYLPECSLIHTVPRSHLKVDKKEKLGSTTRTNFPRVHKRVFCIEKCSAERRAIDQLTSALSHGKEETLLLGSWGTLSRFTFCLINCTFSVWSPRTVMFCRSSDPQTRRRGAGETDGPHGEDRRGHRRHPPLRHHFPRSGSPHEEKVHFAVLPVEIRLEKRLNLLAERSQIPPTPAPHPSFIILYIPSSNASIVSVLVNN